MANENNLLVKGLGAGQMQLVGDFNLVDASGNNLFSVAAASGNVSCAGTVTSAGSADNNGNLTIANSAPFLLLADSTSSAKQLKVKCDANLAQLRETAGADGSLLVLDLANNRVGVATASPSVALDVTGSIKASALVDLSGISAATSALKVAATSDTPTVAFTDNGTAAKAPTTAPAGFLKITVGSSARYIPFWA